MYWTDGRTDEAVVLDAVEAPNVFLFPTRLPAAAVSLTEAERMTLATPRPVPAREPSARVGGATSP